MTPEAQRIAIAEACGWKWTTYNGRLSLFPPSFWSENTEHVPVSPDEFPGFERVAIVPDYLADLNAMHEAEKVIMNQDWPQYHAELCKVWDRRGNDYGYETHATAAQRAEALLRTIGTWEDSK